MKKTLGGDRLGSGNKMTVELRNFERATFDKSYIWRSTMAAGTLVPFMVEVGLPGDTFDINLECDMKTLPTIGPLFGSEKIQLDVFVAPIRLYQSQLHNNALGIGLDMKSVKLPQIELTAVPMNLSTSDYDNCQINPSCVLKYLGISGVGTPDQAGRTRQFNALALLAYWEIYKNYYANKQEEIGAVIHTPYNGTTQTVTSVYVNEIVIPQNSGANPVHATLGSNIEINYTGSTPKPDQIILSTAEHGDITAAELFRNFGNNTVTSTLNGFINYEKYGATSITFWRYVNASDNYLVKPEVVTFPLKNIDKMRERILGFVGSETNVPFLVNNVMLEPYLWIYGASNSRQNSLNNQEGLAIKTYQSDLFNNWLSTEWIDGPNGINEITKIDTSDGLKIDALILAKKVYNMLNQIAVSGGSYDDWLDAVYMHDRYRRAESPMYMGGLIKELVFQEVVSNSQSPEQPLGTLAGKGVMSKKHKGGNITVKIDEPSYIIGIISLTPRIDYSQGNNWDIHLKTMDDFHKPHLSQIGFQELITEQMAWWDTYYHAANQQWTQKSAGKQPAWVNYMTNVNKTYGNFAIPNNQMFMTFNRRYEGGPNGLQDLTTYIDPAKYNFIFAESSLDAQNYWAQIAVNMTARRKMSAKIMPNL